MRLLSILLVFTITLCFNSRTPGGVRQTITHIIRDVKRFNSRTPGGVRHHASAITDSKIISFNSRTPGGVRPQGREIPYQGYQVSIHAPREGCDSTRSIRAIFAIEFQFTHPGRGATKVQTLLSMPICSFNSRTPGGVRQRAIVVASAESVFQFTHPGRGATYSCQLRSNHYRVSIHAPREGCDIDLTPSVCLLISFNSRTPGGVRPGSPTGV